MKRIDLSGTWTLQSNALETPIDATVPGTVYGALLAANRIPDPYYRDAEYEVREWMRHDYVYERTFDLTCASHHYVELVCEGLDTLAMVRVNGGVVGRTHNMHRSYRFNITPYIRQGKNTVTIKLASPIAYIEKKKAQAPYQYFEIGDAMSGYAHIRKSHAMFGWDWGPQLPDAGPFRSVAVHVIEHGKINHVTFRQHHDEAHVELTVQTDVTWLKDAHTIRHRLFDPVGTFIAESQDVQALFKIEEPKLWWPHDLGDQPLYRVETTLEVQGKTIDTYTRKIGLRTRAWRIEKDAYGKSFTYIHNGIPIFLKGANYIPEDSLLDRVTLDRSRHLLLAAKAANHNTVRVWGGGYYPDSAWYDLCDELGILVWQDFMFACAFYEVDDQAFIQTVKAEVTGVVERLEHHASLILFCGNNEIETAILDWDVPEKARSMEKYPDLFEKIIPERVSATGTDVQYWPSSPSSGGGFNDPNGEAAGDMHYWDVWHGEKPIAHYRTIFPRFLSEFGIQSFPALETVETFTKKTDRNIFSYVMESHQKNRSANRKILHYISEMFRYPESFDALLYVSQLIQAEGVRTAVEHLRRHRDRCMGTLYWQLNDCWPVASWSSIDYYGRWKALHYASKRFYDKVLLSIEESSEKAIVHVTNDTQMPLKGTLEVAIKTLNGETLKNQTSQVTIPKACSLALDTISHELSQETLRTVYVEARLIRENKTHTAIALWVPDKHLELEKPSISVSFEAVQEGYLVSLKSDTLARFVELKCPSSTFDDNYFHLIPNEAKTIHITTELDLKTIQAALTIRTLWDTY